MIITRVPFRVSFFGGGTDIPQWFSEEGGQVVSTSIDKYSYVSVRKIPEFLTYCVKLSYSKIELVSNINDLEHPLVRVILEDLGFRNIEIHYDADLPAQSGLGTSSSFGVGLYVALKGLASKMVSKREAAQKVIYYERELLKEAGGYQDQVAASYGGFNHIQFQNDGSFIVNPLMIEKSVLEAFKNSLMLCYIPIKRLSAMHSLAKDYNQSLYEKKLKYISASVNNAIDILCKGNGTLEDLGSLLHEVWCKKREFTRVSNREIDDVYSRARRAGALGGKLLGAGGGGFMLIFCPLEKQVDVRRELSDLMFVPFDFDQQGFKVIYYNL